jgi:hypothetical protein
MLETSASNAYPVVIPETDDVGIPGADVEFTCDNEHGTNSKENHQCQDYLIAYSAATLATFIKTVAWWFNQWPFMTGYNFGILWITSACIAGCEYLPMTFSFQYASSHGVALSLMTAYMEASDNLFRMIQQYALGDTLK